MNIVGEYRRNPAQWDAQGRMICRFYQRGVCRFGARCRNSHEEAVSPATNSPKHQNQVRNNVRPWNDRNFVPSAKTTSATNSPNTASGPSTSSIAEAGSAANTMSCGICFDTVMEKTEIREQIFGILPNCMHCFCFACIRRWRQSKEFEFDVSKACPECRRPSEYVYPSKVWYEVKEAKESFITKEKTRMQKIDCRYFNKGTGKCPFGNTCLYLHALPNGTKMDVGPPKPRKPRANVHPQMLHEILYWLNDDELDIEDDEDELDNDSDLDLADPTIAMQYYDRDDIRRYVAIERLLNGNSDSDSDDFNFSFYV